jgi:hypothetical protein
MGSGSNTMGLSEHLGAVAEVTPGFEFLDRNRLD